MDLVFILTEKDQNMRVFGKTICKMVRAKRCGLMGKSIWEAIKTASNMALEYGYGQMVVHTKANGSKVK